MNRITILIAALCLGSAVYAQTYQDVVRFSRHTNFGTARSAAMGGAFTALGGDLSSISSNPASVGVFRKSELGFTPYMNFANTKSDKISEERNTFQLGDLGGVLAFYSPSFDWKGINFGFNYTNLNNFNRKTRQQIGYSENSWLDALAMEANNTTPDLNGYTTGLAVDTWLIHLGENDYYQPVITQGEPVAQFKNIKEDGYQGEYAFSFGTNYQDKLYLGVTIGIQSINYKMKSQYQEALDLESPSGLDYYTFYDYQKMNGVGTNLKFGLIYRPFPELRIGGAIHTPTWYNMNYKMSTQMSSDFWTGYDETTGREGYYFDAPSWEYAVDFNMKTPWKAMLGIATVLGQKAILSADYEFIKYSDAKFSEASDDLPYDYENEDIKTYLRPTHNFRLGAEYRFNSVFSLRGGYAFWDSPYYNNDKKNENRVQSVSGGFGLNFGVFYCDAAYVYKYSKNQTVFYNYIDRDPTYDVISLPVHNKYVSNEARITLGLRF